MTDRGLTAEEIARLIDRPIEQVERALERLEEKGLVERVKPMTDTEKKKIAEIREALEKATPGPWKWVDVYKKKILKNTIWVDL